MIDFSAEKDYAMFKQFLNLMRNDAFYTAFS